MAIKIEFLTGETEKRVSPLYQWDYGQTLEIESLDLPTLIEVHFACPGMTEAIVHVCSVTNGVASVAIPNRCLEQADTITAWIYEISDTTGCTTKVIYIPIIARTRPGRNDEIPSDVSDKYTELISEVNEAVDNLISGNVTVAYAAKATSADRALQADNASTSAYAESAGTAGKATGDKNGRDIVSTYQTKNRGGFQPVMYFSPVSGMLYMFQVTLGGAHYYATIPWVSNAASASLGYGYIDSTLFHFMLKKSSSGTLSVYSIRASDSFPIGELTDVSIMFCQV